MFEYDLTIITSTLHELKASHPSVLLLTISRNINDSQYTIVLL